MGLFALICADADADSKADAYWWQVPMLMDTDSQLGN